ncbi:hypothetical protein BJ508DRAFT_335070 [Ascobolus immersus RN42]|uniref:Uncharacterized protein n=1 Tax=Ascobolus immersus RN42 TaxID=1160509 RepID=A0A3N4HRX9_ASCIM|nr:hypothetical protein BJ508DRAFT_335070 [Ascobolus immersus RN42]
MPRGPRNSGGLVMHKTSTQKSSSNQVIAQETYSGPLSTHPISELNLSSAFNSDNPPSRTRRADSPFPLLSRLRSIPQITKPVPFGDPAPPLLSALLSAPLKGTRFAGARAHVRRRTDQFEDDPTGHAMTPRRDQCSIPSLSGAKHLYATGSFWSTPQRRPQQQQQQQQQPQQYLQGSSTSRSRIRRKAGAQGAWPFSEMPRPIPQSHL